MSQQREWLTDVLESVPSIAFLALWQGQAGLESAGWTGAALAAAVLAGFARYQISYNPILLGVNIHLLIATPVIVALFRMGAPDLGRMLVGYSHRGVLVTIFLVGCALTLGSPRGFLGTSGLPAARCRAYSAILLAASAATILWSFTLATGSSPLLTVVVPLMVLFGLRRFLIARWRDRSNEVDGLVAGMPAFATPPAPDTA
jgi:hypothetical protein